MIPADAWYNAEGTVCLLTEQGLCWEEELVPLVPLALFLTQWLAEPARPRVLSPDDHDGNLLRLEPVGEGQCQLWYYYQDRLDCQIAEQPIWQAAFSQFLAELRVALQQHNGLELDKLLVVSRSFYGTT